MHWGELKPWCCKAECVRLQGLGVVRQRTPSQAAQGNTGSKCWCKQVIRNRHGCRQWLTSTCLAAALAHLQGNHTGLAVRCRHPHRHRYHLQGISSRKPEALVQGWGAGGKMGRTSMIWRPCICAWRAPHAARMLRALVMVTLYKIQIVAAVLCSKQTPAARPAAHTALPKAPCTAQNFA